MTDDTHTHLAQLNGRLSAYVAARRAPPDLEDLAWQLAPHVRRAHRLSRLFKRLYARRVPVDLDAAIQQALIILEEDGFFGPSGDSFPSDPENQEIHP